VIGRIKRLAGTRGPLFKPRNSGFILKLRVKGLQERKEIDWCFERPVQCSGVDGMELSLEAKRLVWTLLE
jgi:hypothetical protein